MPTKAQLGDVAERAAWTFAQAFLAVFVVSDLSTAKAAAVAGLGMALSVVKGFVATKVGGDNAGLPG